MTQPDTKNANDYRKDRPEFWQILDELVESSKVTIDRPKGSTHPRYPGRRYPVDYGYLEGTLSGDKAEIDLFRGSLQPAKLNSLILTIDLVKRDAEIKLMLGCTGKEVKEILDFLRGGQFYFYLLPRNPLAEIICSRRSIRRFQERPVPTELLEELLEAATWAPSAHNRQPWRFVMLNSQESRAKLAEAMGAELGRDLIRDGLPAAEVQAQVGRSRRRIERSPVAILLCLDPSLGDSYPDPARQTAEYIMGVQSVAMAGENLLLAANALGLGGVWICAPLFAPATVKKTLDIPDSWQPQGLLLLGYPAEMPPRRLRRAWAESAIIR